MAYTIKYVSGGDVAEERWLGKLASAHAIARRAVNERVATRVEIYNEAGELIFHVPRVMHRA